MISIRNLFKRSDEEQGASGRNSRLAQRFLERGITAERNGSSAKALEYYFRAVRADNTFAQAHLNLGIAQQTVGSFTEAIASYARAIALDPEYVAAHYNLACTYLLRSQYSEAETEFHTALRFRDAFPEAWVGLASALEALGRNEDALAALDKALALRSDYVGALLNSLTLLRKLGRSDSAAANSRRVLDLEPDNYLAHGTLGFILHSLGQPAEAESSYRLALTFNPGYTEVKLGLASLLRAKDRNEEAIVLLLDATVDEPTSIQLRRSLAEALNGFALNKAEEKQRQVLLSLCLDDDLLGFVVPSIIALVKSDAGFLALQDSARRGEDPFVGVVPPVAAFLRDPLLLAALPRITIADVDAERVLGHVRRCILFRFKCSFGSTEAGAEVPAEFICAMARQCFFSEYAFSVDENELQRVTSLRASLQDKLSQADVDPRTYEPSLAVASLYGPLHSLNGFERLVEYSQVRWSDAFLPLVQEQVENHMRERTIARQLASITTIDDDISKSVRAQYEDNPYPRWLTAQTPNIETIESLSKRLRPGQEVRMRPRPVPILIAGCGTGRQSITVARAFPDSEILAIDLSLASLAYAARMTDKFGISNVTYRQGDILKLGDLDRRFAIIECSGVLHHLADPMAGWRVLVGLLEPDGLMKIALYSEKARVAVRAAREIVRTLNLPSTPEGIRYCREAIMRLPDGHQAKKVMTCTDFFTLDGCRDFIMHVHEHQFTLPRIETCLDQLGLQFLGFECSAAARNRFRAMFPASEVDNNLKAWHQFEETYPETFFGTYSFWCCKQQHAARVVDEEKSGQRIGR